nr:hypothetical protein [uncultured Desulfobacter sp.]
MDCLRAENIKELISVAGTITAPQIHKHTNKSRQQIHRLLKKLENVGDIKSVGRVAVKNTPHNQILYTLTPEAWYNHTKPLKADRKLLEKANLRAEFIANNKNQNYIFDPAQREFILSDYPAFKNYWSYFEPIIFSKEGDRVAFIFTANSIISLKGKINAFCLLKRISILFLVPEKIFGMAKAELKKFNKKVCAKKTVSEWKEMHADKKKTSQLYRDLIKNKFLEISQDKAFGESKSFALINSGDLKFKVVRASATKKIIGLEG